MDRWTCCLKLSTQGVTLAVLAVVGFGVCIRSGTHMLKLGFRHWRLVGRQRTLACSAGAQQHDGDEPRQNGEGKIATLSVGQGEPLGALINSYSQPWQDDFAFFWTGLCWVQNAFSIDFSSLILFPIRDIRSNLS